MIPAFLAITICSAFIFFQPATCHADAISPLINLFTPETAVPTSIITTVIILVEAILLRRWVKTVPFKTSLLQSLLMNLASSAAGSVIILLFFKEKMALDMFGLFIPMFILTLIVETPILRYLYRHDEVEWPRAMKLSFSLNLVSYCIVFVLQFGFIFAWLGYAGFEDKKTPKESNDLSLLKGETGKIVFTKDTESNKTAEAEPLLKAIASKPILQTLSILADSVLILWCGTLRAIPLFVSHVMMIGIISPLTSTSYLQQLRQLQLPANSGM